MSSTKTYQGGQQDEIVDFSNGALSSAGYQWIDLRGGNDQVLLGRGQWVLPGAGFDVIRGVGLGQFGVSYRNSPAAITIRADWGRTENDGWGNQDLLQGVNAFIGSDYDDLIRGSGKNEQFGEISDLSLGNDTYVGNGGYDTAVYAGKASAYTVTTKDGATFVEDRANGSVDRLESISQIRFADQTLDLQAPGNGNLTIYASNKADQIDKEVLLPTSMYGRWGDYYALAGDDEIRWAHGNVYGGPGNDRIIGIKPNENTWAQYGNSPGPVFISLKDGYALDGWGTRDVLININRVSPSWGYADTVIGSDGDDELWASGGGDLIDGGTGDDLVHYWNGDRRPLLISYKSSDSSYVVRWGARSTEQAVFKNIERFQEDLPGSSRTTELSKASLVNDQVFNTSNLAVGSRSTVVKGGEGSDQFYLADQQWAEPGAGYDLLRGVGNGVFGIRFDSSPAGVTVRADWGSVENDGFGNRDALQGVNAFFGSRFSDSIRGSGVDEFFGSANDLSSGNDTYVGGGGFDVVRYVGNASDYRVITNATEGYTSVEHIKSRTIDRLEQIAQIQFKDSTQTLQSPAKGNKQHWGSEASDVISRNAFYNSDTGVWSDFYGGGGDDDIRWTNGNMIGGPGNDKLTISGNSDSGWVSYNDSPTGVYVDLQKGYALDGWGGRDSLINVSRVALSNHRDTVLGTTGNDEFWDSWGGDSIDGGAGSDKLYLWGGDKANYTLNWRESESSWELRWRADDNGFMLLKNMEILEVNYPNGKAQERIDLSSSNKVSAKAFTVNAELKGSSNNVLNTGSGDDQISLSPGSWVISSSGYDTIIGQGYGSFGIRFDDSPKAVNVRADWGRVENDGWGFQDRLYGVNAFIGSPFNDYIKGQNTDEQFGDALAYTKGNDTYVGGGGYDVVHYFGASSEYRVDYNLEQSKGTVKHLGTGRTDTIEQISLIRFSDSQQTLITPGLVADAIYGSDAADSVNKKALVGTQFYRNWINYDGGLGNDNIEWTNGNVTGGPGNDRITGLESSKDLALRYDDSPSGVFINLLEGFALDGWGGRDTLTNVSNVRGTGFRDTLVGTQGDDEFWDSWGGDTIDGAGGSDLFNFWIGDKANYTVSYDEKNDSYIVRWRSDPNGSITLKNIETLRENNNNNQSRLIQLKEIPKVSDIELDFAAPPSQASPASGVLTTPPSPVEGGPGSDFIQIVANQWIEASSGFDYYRGIGQGLFGLSFGKSPKGVVVRSDWGRVENDGWGQQDRLEGINAFFGSPHSDEIRGSNLDDRFGASSQLSGGNDSYWGGGGFDTISYPGPSNDYQINGQLSSGTVTIRHLASGKVDSLQEMESITFSDRNITNGEPWFNQGTIWGSSSAENVVQTQFYDDPNQRNTWFNYNGGVGNDSISWTNGEITGGPGDDRLEALADNVRVRFDDSPNAVLVDLKAGYALDGWGGRDRLINIRQINGLTGYADTVIGSDQDDRIWYSDGGDTIDGGAGFDVLEFWAGGNRSNYYISYSDDLSFTLRWQYNATSYIVLKNFEGIRINHPDPGQSASVLLSELITWEEQAPKALIGPQQARWNVSRELGTAAEVSFSFMKELPGYGSGGLGSGFQALSNEQQQQLRTLFADASKISGLVLREVPDSAASQIRIGANQQSLSKAYSFSPDAAQGALAGDIWLDLDILSNLAPGSVGYWATLQELGHALGLRKPAIYGQQEQTALQAGQSMLTPSINDMTQTVMSDVLGITPIYPSEFGVLDTVALIKIYGNPSKPRGAGDDIYRLNDVVGARIMNVFDDGGSDRIDGAELSYGATIDLRPNASSSAGVSAQGYAALNNIQIGPGTIIEEVVGTRQDDVLIGNQANNWFYPGSGNDFIDGSDGIDTVVIDAYRSNITLGKALSAGSFWLTDKDGSRGSKQVQNIERVIFNDGLGLRLDFDRGAGKDAALLIGALFGPQKIHDGKFFGAVVTYFDQGGTLKSAIELLLKTGFVSALAGQNSDKLIYNYVFTNIHGKSPETNNYGSGGDLKTQTILIETLATSSENANRVDLVGLQQNGLEYSLS